MVDILGQFGRGLGIGEQIAQAPTRNALAQLGVQQQQQALQNQQQAFQQREAAEGRSTAQFDQSQALRRAQIVNQSARALKQIAPEQRRAAYQRLEPRLQQFGIDTSQFQGATFQDPELDEVIAGTQGIISDPSSLSASMRERQSLLSDIEPFLDKQGNFDEKRASSKALSAARELNIISKPGATTKEERLAEDPELTQKVAKSQSIIKGAVEEERVVAKARGENFNELRAAESAMPGIEQVVGQLRLLVDDATFTLSGKAFNRIAKELGYSANGDTARSSMIAIVDNQVLPLLRPIFGAAFTKAEGDSLKAALINPDSTPESRRAQLDAFLTQMQRNIETKRLQQQPGQQTGQKQPAKRIRFDSQGNIVQ